MALSKLTEKCRNCPCQLTCDHKEMEMIGFLPIPEGGLNNPDIDIMVGVDLAGGSDMCSEVTLSMADAINAVGNPYPVPAHELRRAMEVLAKECGYEKLG